MPGITLIDVPVNFALIWKPHKVSLLCSYANRVSSAYLIVAIRADAFPWAVNVESGHRRVVRRLFGEERNPSRLGCIGRSRGSCASGGLAGRRLDRRRPRFGVEWREGFLDVPATLIYPSDNVNPSTATNSGKLL